MSAAKIKVLVIDDEPPIRKLLRMGFSTQGYEVLEASNGKIALELLAQDPALIILDLGLPDIQGHELLRMIRGRNDSVPIVVLSSRGDEAGKVQALDLGADDYLTKPFAVEELAARLRTVVRRRAGEPAHLLRVADLSMDLLTRKVTRGDEEIALSAREFELLEFLMRSPGRVFGRVQIYEHVWGYDMDLESNLVEVYVQRLRAKIDRDHHPKLIRTVRGIGYVLGGED